MASMLRETTIQLSPELVWDAVRDVGAVHTRLAPGFVTETKMDEGARVVTFHNGMVARELIVTVDEKLKRLVWAVVGTRLTHHNASLQVFPEVSGASRVVWIADLLPNELAGMVAGMIEDGMRAMKRALDSPRA